ncbi:MAG: putative glycoside hydrolase [Dehalococcoidia bacterium]|nr:putative glycoside hydrolase [Dehalococcoidia bacterium]
MDAFATDPSWQPTINDRYAGMVMYPPYSDRFTFYAGEGFFYLDAYAIYVSSGRNDTGTSIQHILRDGSGKPCYLPWGSPFTQYAADVGNPAFRDLMVSYITQKLAAYPHYDGVYLDDVNLDLSRVSCGNQSGSGNNSSPIDPRTGQVMTNQNWKRYLVEFLEQVRNAIPAKKIVHNTVWYLLPFDDPYLVRQISAADYVEMEQGFVDEGLTGGTGTFSWLKKMQFVDLVHSLGASLLDQDEDIRDTEGQKYGLANYLLFSNGTDFYSTFYEANPDQPWTVYEADLGAALGPRYSWNGLWRRDFEGGFALVNPPGGSTRSANLGATHSDPWGGSFSSITLNARQGTVVVTR